MPLFDTSAATRSGATRRVGFTAGLRFAIFEASIGLATCPYSDEVGQGGQYFDACACSTGVLPQVLFGGSSSPGQLVPTPLVGCSQGRCMVNNPEACHHMQMTSVSPGTGMEVYPLGWGGSCSPHGSVAVDAPVVTRSCASDACPPHTCHPEASCLPTLGGYICQCHYTVRGPPGFMTFGAGAKPCIGEGVDLAGRQHLSLRACTSACRSLNSTAVRASATGIPAAPCNGFAWNSRDQRCYLKSHPCSSDTAECPWARPAGDDEDWSYFTGCSTCSADGTYFTNFGEIQIHGSFGTYRQVPGGLSGMAWSTTDDGSANVLQGNFRNGARTGRFEFVFVSFRAHTISVRLIIT